MKGDNGCDMVAANGAKVIWLSRMLSDDNKIRLLEWVHLAFAAENSVRNVSGFDLGSDEMVSGETREYSRGDFDKRGEER